MNRNSFSAAIAMREVARAYSHCGTQVLSLTAGYPQIALCGSPPAQMCINGSIKAQVNGYLTYASNDLYCAAVAAFRASRENDYPFLPFETVMNYEAAYNQNCHLSLYRDKYEFTGGAHGSTIRSSDTWSLSTGERLGLSSFFSPGTDYKAFLTDQITKQAKKNMEQNPGIYFEEYPALIKESFNENSFFLTPEGLAVYYQQYEIAPYATGIVTFIIPYGDLGWQPSC